MRDVRRGLVFRSSSWRTGPALCLVTRSCGRAESCCLTATPQHPNDTAPARRGICGMRAGVSEGRGITYRRRYPPADQSRSGQCDQVRPAHRRRRRSRLAVVGRTGFWEGNVSSALPEAASRNPLTPSQKTPMCQPRNIGGRASIHAPFELPDSATAWIAATERSPSSAPGTKSAALSASRPSFLARMCSARSR